uniref:Nudix hydrolase domain-containing protein n=1 Tax=viral metagenome TaxID=1070528 RepID=A0A6C0DQC8_9ZZZZ
MSVKEMYCNNCGEKGHVFRTCKDPIISCGILLLRGPYDPLKLPVDPRTVGVLMVKRKDSMAYMEFIRGKYELGDTEYLERLIGNMTLPEQKLIVAEEFDTLWTKLWGQGRDTHSAEYEISKSKYYQLDRVDLTTRNRSKYSEPEWGFPKGRRMRGESDSVCAVREFFEETNIPPEAYTLHETLKFTETFKGTNNIMYRHIYFVAMLKDSKIVNLKQKLTFMQSKEISEVDWKSLSECKSVIRPHYTERLALMGQVERLIATHQSL